MSNRLAGGSPQFILKRAHLPGQKRNVMIVPSLVAGFFISFQEHFSCDGSVLRVQESSSGTSVQRCLELIENLLTPLHP